MATTVRSVRCPGRVLGGSASTGVGFPALLEKIDEVLSLDPVSPCVFRFSTAEGSPLHLLHEHAQVTSISYDENGSRVEALVPESIKRRLKRYLVAV